VRFTARIEVFVHLVEDVVSEKLDDGSVTGFRPTMRPAKPKKRGRFFRLE
jgi:hypothetical protein